MQKKQRLTVSSKRTRKPSKRPESTLAEDLIAGFKELIAHNRGEIKLRTRKVFIFRDIDVKTIREQTGLSQADFAFQYGFNPRTLQKWEQGRAKPETAVLAYLKVIAKNPEGVQAALNQP